jgi:HEAT repeat protein
MRIPMILSSALFALGLTSASTAEAGVQLDSLEDAWARSALAGATALDASQPELAQSIRAAEPRSSRSGAPLFIDPSWSTPEAAGAIIVRLAQGEDTPDERVALLDALSRTGSEWTPAVVGLLSHETHPAVRRMMVELMRDAPVDTARSIVKVALQDASPEVRAAALRVVGFHKSGQDFAALAVPGLRDADPAVRAEAARSIGYAGYTDGFSAIRDLLTDDDASVRFRALRSLEKLDMPQTRQLTELGKLAVDSDLKVAREAQKLQAQ